MIVYFKGLKTPYVAAIDIEHDQGHMIQFAGILMKRVGEELYQVERSINFYVKRHHLNDFTTRYTHISVQFLEACGISLDEAQTKFYEEFIGEIPIEDITFVSHGIKQDSIVMRDSGLDINEAPHLCTYNLAKQILKRDKRVKLSDVLNEAGFCSVLEHNAYTDALETIYALSFLLKQEED